MIRFGTFPAIIVALFLGLTVLQVNQSSIALVEPNASSDPALIAGTPRAIRWDESMLSTPAQIGSVRKNSSDQLWLGLNDIKLDVVSLGAPVRDWTMAFRPQSWGLLLAGNGDSTVLGMGFAWQWWMPLAIGLLGVYALLLALRPRPLVAAALSTVVALAPYVAWWSGAPAGTILGFVAGAGGALITSWRTRTGVGAVAWGLLAAWLVVDGFFALYPAWLLSIGLVVGLVVAGAAIDVGVTSRRVLGVATAVIFPVGLALVAWYEQNKVAIAALLGTHYPGQRHSVGGQGRWSDLLSAPANFYMSFQPATLDLRLGAEGNPNNLSEASSVWLPLPVLVLIVILVGLNIARRRPARTDPKAPQPLAASRTTQDKYSAVATVLGLVVLISWAMFRLPDVFGTLLLDRIPGFRTYLAIGLAAVILVHLAAERVRLNRRAGMLWGSVAVGCSSAITGLATSTLLTTLTGIVWSMLVSAVVATIVLLLVFVRPARPIAAVGLVIISVGSFAVVGPLYRGLGPLVSSPLATYLAQQAAKEGPTRWVALEPSTQPILAASEDSLLSGMTYYPDPEIWNKLAPRQESIWNNYNEVFWSQDPAADPAFLVQGKRRVDLHIDLCSPKVAFLGVQYVVTSPRHEAALPCFTPVTAIDDLGWHLTVWRNRHTESEGNAAGAVPSSRALQQNRCTGRGGARTCPS